MTLRAAAEQALDALDYAADRVFSESDDDPIGKAREALRAALSAPEPDSLRALLADGYVSGGATYDGKRGGSMTLNYKTGEQAEAVFTLLTDMIDAALAEGGR
ncbi:MAG: hypothetical protein KA200_00010 [Burkholderiales bacterium]|nr:hypothetical protein [Burkholderiales bacterium]